MFDIQSIIDFLPKSITIGERVFLLHIYQVDEDDDFIPFWWIAAYFPADEQGLPPIVHDNKDWYYLVSTSESKEDAILDMYNKISTMNIDESVINKNKIK